MERKRIVSVYEKFEQENKEKGLTQYLDTEEDFAAIEEINKSMEKVNREFIHNIHASKQAAKNFVFTC